MKNQNLKALMALKASEAHNDRSDVMILNQNQLVHAMGGTEDSPCPMLTSCGTYSPECNAKCAVKDIKVEI